MIAGPLVASIGSPVVGPYQIFIGDYLPYFAVTVFVVGMLSRLASWSTAPLHLRWELHPHPVTASSKLKEMGAEIFSFRSLYNYNRRMWYASLPFHEGLYLLVLWFVLMMAGVPKLFNMYVATTGAILIIVGVIALLTVRLFDRGRGIDSAFVEYFNLVLILAIVLTGLYVGLSGVTIGVRSYVFSLIALTPRPPADPMFLASSFLVMVFGMYFPYSRMIHPLAKYFTIDKVRWGA